MKISSLLYFMTFGFTTVIFKQKKPLFGTLILTDKCNLSCKHCALSNINSKIYPYIQIKKDMELLFQRGVRVLCFSGGEPLLWTDNGKTIKDLIAEAKEIGFPCGKIGCPHCGVCGTGAHHEPICGFCKKPYYTLLNMF